MENILFNEIIKSPILWAAFIAFLGVMITAIANFITNIKTLNNK